MKIGERGALHFVGTAVLLFTIFQVLFLWGLLGQTDSVSSELRALEVRVKALEQAQTYGGPLGLGTRERSGVNP